ncbi:hypothetical protein GCM10011321_31320 [Youhaiella tibetensis]|uniref:Uncharacterized protein n=1 Tax=Paradevosia tibetensis TaxID=1447062 RepID=A0A5B9DIN1_9HYPH|nr:hypothetical protein [Youhaiella tibetensis]QEE18906.1 hypothetical protein FNA67_01355 [Youhaiella tibetensis]GGF38133.1 hypothetical protein GCM10011321_31320 [Youhaiella tibetensis]
MSDQDNREPPARRSILASIVYAFPVLALLLMLLWITVGGVAWVIAIAAGAGSLVAWVTYVVCAVGGLWATAIIAVRIVRVTRTLEL